MATHFQIDPDGRSKAQECAGPRAQEGDERPRFHAVMHGIINGVRTPVIHQPAEPLAPSRLDGESLAESPALARFEISQNEPILVNIHRTKALNCDHPDHRGLDLNLAEPLMPPCRDRVSSAGSPTQLDLGMSQNERKLVSIDRSKAINPDHRQDPAIDFNPIEPLMRPGADEKLSIESLVPAKFEKPHNEPNS